MKARLNLAELSKRCGVPPRTIRFYIARSLMAGPDQAGRGAAYGPEHVRRLEEIAQLKGKGLTLTEIGRALAGGSHGTEESLPPGVATHAYTIVPDVTVLVHAGIPPWRMNRIRKAIAEMATRLKEEIGNEKAE